MGVNDPPLEEKMLGWSTSYRRVTRRLVVTSPVNIFMLLAFGISPLAVFRSNRPFA
jgi:hypothetical protein